MLSARGGGGAFTASATFAFESYEGQGRAGVNESVDLSGIHYVLEQVAPTTD